MPFAYINSLVMNETISIVCVRKIGRKARTKTEYVCSMFCVIITIISVASVLFCVVYVVEWHLKSRCRVIINCFVNAILVHLLFRFCGHKTHSKPHKSDELWKNSIQSAWNAQYISLLYFRLSTKNHCWHTNMCTCF